MTRTQLLSLVFAGAGIATAGLLAQDGAHQQQGTVGPLAITGSPASAEYCVAGNAARVHPLGWVEAGTTYRITFDSNISIVAAAVRMNLAERRHSASYGTPDLNFTASTSGTMAILVTGNGTAGCYRYKAQITAPSASAAATRPEPPAPRSVSLDLPRSPIQTMAIAGEASTVKHCVSGNWTAKVHDIGWIDAGAAVTVDFDSDFNPIAGVTITDVAGQQTVSYTDDDTGGNLQPRITFTAANSGNAVLHVAGVNGAAGCYYYKLSVANPAVTMAQFAGSYTGTYTGSATGTISFTVANAAATAASAAITATQPGSGTGTLTLASPGDFSLDVQANASFFTQAATGQCTWTGPFIPGGARQSSASGVWSCSNGTSGQWTARRPQATPVPTPTPTPAPTPTPTPTPAPTPAPGQVDSRITSASCSATETHPTWKLGNVLASGTASGPVGSVFMFIVQNGGQSTTSVNCGGWTRSGTTTNNVRCTAPPGGPSSINWSVTQEVAWCRLDATGPFASCDRSPATNNSDLPTKYLQGRIYLQNSSGTMLAEHVAEAQVTCP